MKTNNRKVMFYLAIMFIVLITSCRGDSVDSDSSNILDIGSGEDLRSDSELATDEAVAATATKIAQYAAETEAAKPTSTATPNPAWDYFMDASGDEVVCGGSNTEDGVVDIQPITFKHDNFAIRVIEIGMGEAPGSAFSYAVVIFLQSDGQPLRAFIYEIHDGEEKIGEIDPATFELITPTDTVEGFDIFLFGSNVIFEFPVDFFPNGMNDFFVQSFHMKSQGDSTNCDEAEGSQSSE